MTRQRHLAFVSPRFLFPTDSGGKIRTTQILRGLKGGEFRITLLMPAADEERETYTDETESVSDDCILWNRRRRHKVVDHIKQAFRIGSRYPVSVIGDYSAEGARAVRDILRCNPDIIVFDFPHSAVLAPECIDVPSVMFTHNVESEIFKRHRMVARLPWKKAVWGNQYRKMREFEKHVLSEFDTVIAVSERDCGFFEREWRIGHCRLIPTGVDIEFFDYRPPENGQQVVFCGSMDWLANIDAIEYFHDRVWTRIRAQAPAARMKVVGRSPPADLVGRICRKSPEWEFTGFVNDIREHVSGAAAFVIPLRVGGGTRIKAFEAMALGTPVVSTTIGVEGLNVVDGVHVLVADEPESMAAKVSSLLNDTTLRMMISETARSLVENHFDYRKAAQVFETICLDTIARHGATGGANPRRVVLADNQN